MTTFRGSPRLLKGAIIAIAPASLLVSVIVLQYNSDSLSRTLQVKVIAGGGDRSGALRLKGPPVKTIKLEVEPDAMKGRHP